jgi:glutathione S-transferase
MKLYYSKNLNPRVAVAVARHLEAPVEYVRASPRAPENEPAFRAINPTTLVPVLVEADGARLWETDAIACRLATLRQPDFWPTGQDAPALQMWISWSNNHFTRTASVFYWEYVIKPLFGATVDDAAIAEASGDFHRFARVLDDALADREWLVGGALSYADFRVATPLPFAEAARMPLAGYANIRRWHQRLWDLPAWRDPFAGLA